MLFVFVAAVKEPPYILKESGYAGFNLPIDIYFKCRDDTKKVTYNYDLSLNTTGTFAHKELKTHWFKNPSDDFRRKLLKGGGVATVTDRVSNADDKSRESTDDRPQLISKPKLGGGNDSSGTKKYKTKTDDPKATFSHLFGSSNTKSSKVSPDPKNKASPSLSASSKHQTQSSSGQKSEKSSRDRPEKEKKEKNKHTSPHKEAKSLGGKDVTKKADDRREDQKKDKLHSKERDRSKDKPPKQRPPSPKPRSPKRTVSPAAKIGPVSSTKEDTMKFTSKSSEASTVSERPSSSAKKSKKDKKEKSHDKDRERDRKDKEHKSKEERPSSKISDKISTKKDGSSTPKDASIIKDKNRNTEVKPLVAPDPPTEPVIATKIVPANDKKVEKDPDRKHKHKKKDKNKDKDVGTKDRKKEKLSKSKDEPAPAPVAASPIKRQTPVETPAAVTPAPVLQPSQISATKPNPLNTLLKESKVSSDSEDDHPVPNIVKPAGVDLAATANANSNIPDGPSRLIDEQPVSAQIDKSVKRVRKDKGPEKEDKKRKRKSKDDAEVNKRKTPSPAVTDQEPPQKIPKKDERSVQPLAPPPPQSATTQLDHRSSPATVPYQPKSSPAPTGAHSNLRATPSQQQQSHQQLTLAAPNAAVDYMSELKNLQHKIMTLQDNQELQQVVEMIAETGCYEITSKTFDFDLCALDRTTVQRLLDFFAKSCS